MQQYLTQIFIAGLALSLPAGCSAKINERRQNVVTVTQTVAAPLSSVTAYNWAAGATPEYPIHSSCNASERALLRKGLNEAVLLAEHARDHILRFGNTSELYTKYFGNAPTAEPAGWFEKIARGDKSGILFRCDDIDGNCAQPGWGGHWRGENATDETVICPLSYTTRMPLEGLCGYGYTVAAGKLNFYFGSDLVHRILHVTKIGEGVVEHYADSYAECLELAKSNPAEAVRNSHTLQYFSLDAYAHDIAVPGEGCTGKAPKASTSAAAAPPSTTSQAAATKTSTASAECHTHADGVVHCT